MTTGLEFLTPPPADADRDEQPARRGIPGARIALITLNLIAVTFFLFWTRHGVAFGPYRIDLDVYRIGGRAWLHGDPLYAALPPTRSGARLPFSYPPFAAVLLSPLSLVPMAVAGTILTLATIGLTALALLVFLRSLGGVAAGSWLVLGLLLPAALFLEPVRNTIDYGQVNIGLMTLVTLDCLVSRPCWPRGLLVGVAAAVKLTPAAFLLFFLARRDFRSAGLATLSFIACTGAGFLADQRDSTRYWTSVVFQLGRPGDPSYAANQSIEAVTARAGLAPSSSAGIAVWLTLSAVVVALAWRGMRGTAAQTVPAWALSLNAFAALLVSPISWSHHWGWGETAVLVLVILGLAGRGRGELASATAGLAVFAIAPQWALPHDENRELHWAAWEQVVGSSYVIFAVVILVLSARWRDVFPRGGTLAAGEREAFPGPVVGGRVDG